MVWVICRWCELSVVNDVGDVVLAAWKMWFGYEYEVALKHTHSLELPIILFSGKVCEKLSLHP